MRVKELAIYTGISKHTLDNYLNVREHIPTADAAVKIAQALGVSVEYLVTGEENSRESRLVGPDTRALLQNFKLLGENDRKIIIGMVQLIKNQRKVG